MKRCLYPKLAILPNLLILAIALLPAMSVGAAGTEFSERIKAEIGANRNLATCINQDGAIFADGFESGINGTRIPVMDIVDRPPPIASLITVGTPAPNGTTAVSGAPGAVPAGAFVMVASLAYSTPDFDR